MQDKISQKRLQEYMFWSPQKFCDILKKYWYKIKGIREVVPRKNGGAICRNIYFQTGEQLDAFIAEHMNIDTEGQIFISKLFRQRNAFRKDLERQIRIEQKELMFLKNREEPSSESKKVIHKKERRVDKLLKKLKKMV